MNRSASRPTPPSPLLDGLNFALHQHYVSTYIELVRDRKIKRPLLSGSLKMMAAWPVKEFGLGTDGRPLCGTPNLDMRGRLLADLGPNAPIPAGQ